MKVALIHDWLTGMRGGEKCLEVLCELFPTADIFTLLHKKGSASDCIESRNINTSFIQKLPFSSKYRRYLPWFPTAIEMFDLNGYDLVISSSHCVAKGVITRPDAVHVCYCHTPMRYVWDMYHSYFGEKRLSFFTRSIYPSVANYLRMWDVTSSSRVGYFIANSHYVANRISKYYGRKSAVIYPPVDCSMYGISGQINDYYLIVSAFAPYKRVDIAIQAFDKLKLPLVVIGSGQDEKRLKKMSSNNVKFLGWQPSETIREYYAKCKALIFPGEEDFGIVPLEAQASGRPVIAYGRGGVCETVIPVNHKNMTSSDLQPRIDNQHSEVSNSKHKTGLFFYEQSVKALVNAIKEFEKVEQSFNSQSIRAQALKFDRPVFKARIKEYIEQTYKEHNQL